MTTAQLSTHGDPVTDADICRFVIAGLLAGLVIGIFMNQAWQVIVR